MCDVVLAIGLRWWNLIPPLCQSCSRIGPGHKDLGDLSYFLGIKVTKSSNGALLLSQQKYISDILKKAGMSNAKPISTPMVVTSKLVHGDPVFHNPQLYRSVVGSLHYATITHPKISFAVNKASQDHWKSVKHILRYLKGAMTCGLCFTKAPNFSLYYTCGYEMLRLV